MVRAPKCTLWLFVKLKEQWESSEYAFYEAALSFQERVKQITSLEVWQESHLSDI